MPSGMVMALILTTLMWSSMPASAAKPSCTSTNRVVRGDRPKRSTSGSRLSTITLRVARAAAACRVASGWSDRDVAAARRRRPCGRAGESELGGDVDRVVARARGPCAAMFAMPASALTAMPQRAATRPRMPGVPLSSPADPGPGVERVVHRELVVLAEPAPDRLRPPRRAIGRRTYVNAGAPGPPLRNL